MSIARVAEAANVSYATAWRVINNHPAAANEDTIAAVRAAMAAIGYAPTTTNSNTGRRRGRPNKARAGIRTHNIALLQFRQGTMSMAVLADVQKMLGQHNLNLLFAQVDDHTPLPQAIRTGNVDGILGYGEFPEKWVAPNLFKIPAVWMMSRADNRPDPWGDRVKPNHLEIGELAAQILKDRGHTSVAYLDPDPDLPMYQHRLASFAATADRLGLNIQTYHAPATTNPDQAAQRLADQWFNAKSRPTGLFVPVDRVTLHVHRHLEERNVLLGKDVELVSCDNDRQVLSLMQPAPVSLDLNTQTIARLAVERLLWRMQNGPGSPQVAITVSPTVSNAYVTSAQAAEN